ncbi:MAG TPA: invasin domain 3-containing protein [Thermoanaerobaculia bacterium]|nr:invasin domain 3-containing protein [Thermoanaerobaculia bacterium]
MRKALLLLAAIPLTLLGCAKGNPVAPTGSTLVISADPIQIGLTGTSTITVYGRRPDGNAFLKDTEIQLSTTLGSVPAIVKTDAQGTARATLTADGRPGKATVTATTNASSGGSSSSGSSGSSASAGGAVTASIDVTIGAPTESKPQLLVSVNPSNIAVQQTATVTVIARNADQSPVSAGKEVILTTTLGSISPSRPTTDSDGVATATMDAGSQAGTATVTALLGTSDPATASVTIRDAATDINLQANPSSIPRANSSVTLTAFVTNSQGQPLQGAPVTFKSQRGTLSTTGVVFTDTTGVATNTLTLQQQELTNVSQFTATASTPSGSGQILEATTTIVVQ